MADPQSGLSKTELGVVLSILLFVVFSLYLVADAHANWRGFVVSTLHALLVFGGTVLALRTK